LPIQDLFTRAQWGKSYGATKGTWYKVPFEATFLSEPSVVIIGVARSGTLKTRVIEKVTTARVAAVDKIVAAKIAKFEIPRIGIGTADEVGRKVGDAYRDKAKDRLGDWTPAFNWMRDLILSAVWALGYITGTWIHWMYTILVQPQIDQVRDAVNNAISGQVDRINSALSSQVDRINTRLSGLVDNVNAATSDQVDRVIARVNAVLTDLYDSWGLPSGVIATPVHVRNVSTTGFEWQSYGDTTIHYIAIGKTRTKLFEPPGIPTPAPPERRFRLLPPPEAAPPKA